MSIYSINESFVSLMEHLGLSKDEIWKALEERDEIDDLWIQNLSRSLPHIPNLFEVDPSRGISLLGLAVKKGQNAVLQTLIQHACKTSKIEEALENIDEQKNTALHIACIFGHTDIVIALLEVQTQRSPLQSLGAKSLNGFTPLRYAVENGHNATVIAILNYAQENQILNSVLDAGNGLNNHTALHAACIFGHADVATTLLLAQAQIPGRSPLRSLEMKNSTGFTPLNHAAERGHNTTIIALLHHANQNQILPFVINAKNGPLKITSLHAACFNGHIEAIITLLEAQTHIPRRSPLQSLSMKDSRGNTPLIYAANQGQNGAVTALLDYANQNQILPLIIDAQNRTKRTALHTACFNNRADVVSTLLHFGASSDISDNQNLTPLSIAKHKPAVGREFFFHLTGGPGNAEAFFQNTAERFSSILEKSKRDEPVDLTNEFFPALDAESNISDALSLEICDLPTNRSLGNYSFELLTGEVIRTEALRMQALLETGNLTIEMLKEIESVSRASSTKILQLLPRVKRVFSGAFKDQSRKTLLSLKSEFENMRQRASSLITTKESSQFGHLQKAFDDKDIFQILSQWNIGMGRQLPCEDDTINASSSTQALNPKESYLNLLNVEASEIYELGLCEGRDLRVLGIDCDIEALFDHLGRSPNNPEILLQIKHLLDQKCALWKEVLKKDHAIELEGHFENLSNELATNAIQSIKTLHKQTNLDLLRDFLENKIAIRNHLRLNRQETLFGFQATDQLSPMQMHQQLTEVRRAAATGSHLKRSRNK